MAVTLTPSLLSVCADRCAGRPTKGETHEIASRICVGAETHMQAARRQVRPAAKEEKANQQGHTEENPDSVFHRDTF